VSDVWLTGESEAPLVAPTPLEADTSGSDFAADPAEAVRLLRFAGVRVINWHTQATDAFDVPQDAFDLELDEHSGLGMYAEQDLAWSAPWSDLAECSTLERVYTRGGKRCLLLRAATRDGSSLSALLPVDHPGRVETAIRKIAAGHGVRGRRSVPPAPLAIAVVAATATTVAACLALAGHSLHL
jgi:hypothetical protein